MSGIGVGNFVGESGEESPMFTGTSITGDFGEALRIAIAEAKRQLTSSLVSWRLASLTGVNGGFIGQTDLTVAIYAIAGGDAEAAEETGVRAVGPDKRYSYGFGYGFFLVRAGNRGGYMLGVEPAMPEGTFTTCRLAYVRELTIQNNTLPGWVYRATQLDNNNPNPIRYFFLASQPDQGTGKYYIGFSDASNDVTKFQNNTYTVQAAVTDIDQ